MVSIKSLTLLTLSISAVTAVPQYAHARFHRRTDAGHGLPRPDGLDSHNHDHQQNDTGAGSILELRSNQESNAQRPEAIAHAADNKPSTPCLSTATEYVTSVQVATVTAPVRRWDRTRQGGWGGKNSWTQDPNTPAVPEPSSNPIGVSVGVSVGIGSDPTATTSAAMAGSTDTSGSTGGSSSGGKKGLSYNSNSLLNQFSSAGASWAYNWAAGAGGAIPAGVEYVPMLWGKDSIASWSSAVKTAIAGGAKHALSFNEPDFPQQSNIDPQTAAKLHIANMVPLAGQVKIGSPAMTNSNIKGQGLDWMTSFLSACASNCKIDFLTFHWYNDVETFNDFQSHVSQVINLAKQNGIPKVWLTEFAVNGAISDQAAFLKQAIPFLDSQPEVERYAYFMVGNGQMLTNGALNAAGQAYAS